VDNQLRALLRVPVSASSAGNRTELLAWIDTAFNGGLAIPRKLIAELRLSKQSSAEAILADGRSVELETFACFLDWFGNTYETQIAAKPWRLAVSRHIKPQEADLSSTSTVLCRPLLVWPFVSFTSTSTIRPRATSPTSFTRRGCLRLRCQPRSYCSSAN
jgi:hypothetical protein